MYTQTLLTLQHDHIFFFPPSRQTVPGRLNPRKHRTGIQIQLSVRCADYTGIVLLKHCKTESHSPLIREEKRCSCLYSPTKQLAIILSLKFDFYKTEENKKKTCCDMKSVVRV